jgi:hypothetical protein
VPVQHAGLPELPAVRPWPGRESTPGVPFHAPTQPLPVVAGDPPPPEGWPAAGTGARRARTTAPEPSTADPGPPPDRPTGRHHRRD